MVLFKDKLGLLTLDTLGKYDLSALHLPSRPSGEAIALGTCGHAHFFDVSGQARDVAGVLAVAGDDRPEVVRHVPASIVPIR